MLDTLLSLVLPAACAGCDGARVAALCPQCVAQFTSVSPQRVRPDPEPAGLPPTYALAAYGGAMRSALLAYKERGRHNVAGPLGDHLARVALRAIRTPRPVLLIPVPATAAAARRRHGDHITRLARRAARGLRAYGVPAAVVGALRALPRTDSAELSAADRAAAAKSAFTLRAGRLPEVRDAVAGGALVGLVDDIVTTGATLAAAGTRLAEAGVPVAFAAVLAATRKRSAVLHRT